MSERYRIFGYGEEHVRKQVRYKKKKEEEKHGTNE